MLSEYGSLVTPERLDRFEVINELGRGSQGVVYLARDPQLERNVAIKTFHTRGDTQTIKAQLLREARNISRLNHPNILTLYEADEENGQPYLIFEFIDGKSLKEFIKEKGKLKADDVLEIIIPLLDAIAYAHERGIIHRDLTPANIILTTGNIPKIMDFGIADVLGRETDGDAITGSLHYLSPEQCENKPPLPSSDIFTLGLILLEMLTGKRVIEGDNQFTIINQVVNQDIEIPDLIDPAIKKVLKKALNRNVTDRYQNANDMKNNLQSHLNNIKPDLNEPNADDKDSTLQFLLRRMRYKKDFPAMPQQISEIAITTNDKSDASANILANKILKNYSLSTKLLRLVNSPVYGQYGGRISTVSRAVVILGFKEVRLAAMGLMLFDHIENKNQSRMLKEESVSSMMSGSIARELSATMKIEDSEEAYICSMFHKFGRLLTMFYFPEEAEIIEKNIKQKKMSENQASLEVLGLTYEDIGTGVAKAWHLPLPIMKSMQRVSDTKIEKTESSEESVSQLANFSNELCEIIHKAEDDTKETALQNTLKKYSNVIDMTPKQLNSHLSSAVDNVSEYANIFNLNLAESSFMKSLDKWLNKDKTSEQETDKKESHTADEKLVAETSDRGTKHVELLNSVQEISESILDGATLNDVMIMVMETLYRGFDFNRVIFCMINRKNASVDARFGFGQDIDELLKTFRIPIQRVPDIFNLALTKQNDYIVDNIDDPGIADLIPEWYRQKMMTKSLIVYPIIVNKVPMGFIYADKSSQSPISKNEHISVIKTLRNQVIMAIKQNNS